MQLVKLNTENFKKLGTASFDFTEGVNFIAGENFQGKTTLLRAIAVALFGVGTLPGKAEDIATWGTDNWKLELAFTHAGDEYNITRSKTVSRIHKNEELVATGNTACARYIKELINLDAKDYNLLVHSRQGETAYALNYGATALQRKVEEFSGITELDAIAKESRRLGREAFAKVEQAQVQWKSMRSEEDVRADLGNLDSQILQLQKESEVTVSEEPAEPKETVSSIHRRAANYSKYCSELSSYQENLTELQQLLSEAEKPVEDLEELETRRNTLKKKLKDIRTAERVKNSLEIVASKELIKPIEVEVNLIPLEEAATALSQEYSELTTLAKTLEAELKTGKCDSCGTELTEDLDTVRKNLEDARSQLPSLKQKKEEADKALEDAKDANRNLAHKVKQYNKDKQEVEAAKEELESMEVINCYEDAARELSKVDNAIETQETILNNYNRLQSRLNKLHEPEEVAEVTESEISALEQEWEDYLKVKSEVELAKQKVVSVRRELDSVKALKQRVEQELKQLQELSTTISTLSLESDTATELSKYLTSQREQYLQQVWDSILSVASNQLTESSNGSLTSLEIKDGRFFYEEDGRMIPTVEASGAQLAFIGTALRISLNKALYRGDTFLAFDEPTEAMTEENSRSLVASLSGTAKQVIVISHRTTDQGLASNLIEV